MFGYLTFNNIIALLRLVLDICVVWVVIYYCIKIVKNNSRTIQIFKGILLIFIIRFIATFLGLKTVEALANLFVTWGFLAFIIIFQPEIRALLEKLGKTSVFSRISTLTINERERLVDELVKACADMSKTKTGALISLEQGHSLSDFIKTGTQMNSVVTSELLCSIFVPGTPLHDGAVIIQGVKIACAAAYFPPTTKDFPSSYGARHRAAVGISEITDSVTIVVSEETGNISIAEGGKLSIVSDKSLREYLLMIICQTQNEVIATKISKESELENVTDLSKKIDEKEKTKTNRFVGYFKGKNKALEDKSAKPKRFTRVKKEEVEIATDEIKADIDTLFETIIKEDELEMHPKVIVEDLIEKPKRVKVKESTPAKEDIKKEVNKAKKVVEDKESTNDLETPVKRKATKRPKKIKDEVTQTDLFEEKKAVTKTRTKKATKESKNEVKEPDEVSKVIESNQEPEAIVLNYKSSKKEVSPNNDENSEGRNS